MIFTYYHITLWNDFMFMNKLYMFEYIDTWIIFGGEQFIKMWFYEIFEGGEIYIYEIDYGHIYGNGYGYVYTGFENVEILHIEHVMWHPDTMMIMIWYVVYWAMESPPLLWYHVIYDWFISATLGTPR